MRWKAIPGLDYYQVSDTGLVRSISRTVVDSKGRTQPVQGKPIKTRPLISGYIYASVREKGKSLNLAVHRLVLKAFVGEPKAGQECRHLDGDRTNNKVSNLRWGTKKQNMKDQYKHGTRIQGDKHWHSILTKRIVVKLRKLAAKNELDVKEAAKLFNVKQDTIRHAVSGVSWSSLNTPTARIKPHRKLTSSGVLQIRRLRKKGASLKELAGMFSVSITSIALVVSRKTWAYV